MAIQQMKRIMRDIVNTKKALSAIKALIQQNYTMFGSIPLTME